MKLKIILIPFICVILIFCVSCSQIIKEAAQTVAEVETESELKTITEESDMELGENLETESTEQIEIQAEPIDEAELPSSTPSAGCGNVAGRVFWNSKPVNEAKVILCEDFSVFSGCEGKQYEGSTDDKGIYIVENIPVGEYAVLMQFPGEENYIFAGSFIEGADEIQIEEGKTIPLDNMHIFKTDLILTGPSDKEEIENRQPALSWEVYRDADYYLVYLAPEAGDLGRLNDEKVKENSLQVATELLNCKFTWKIEAFNQYGRKIAESEYGNFFIKADCPSCNLKILTPADKETIKLGSDITLSWEKHPLAVEYNIAVANTETGEYPVYFIKVVATSYQIPDPIPEGTYYFSVFALDSFETNIAYGYSNFTVIK